MKYSNRRPSRWKFIFSINDPKNGTHFYELDRQGKILKGKTPKEITIDIKYNSIDEDIKEMFKSSPWIFHDKKKFSFSGNIEIFTTKCRNEDNPTNNQNLQDDIFNFNDEKFLYDDFSDTVVPLL